VTNRKKLLNEFYSFLDREGLDFFIINSTDEYLNEYIELENNPRYLLTGFSGSTGDVIVSQGQAFLFVDGRYHLQAEGEVDPDLITVIKVGLAKPPQKALYEKLAELSNIQTNIGIVSSRTSCAGFKELLKTLEEKKNVKIVEYEQDPVFKMTGVQEKFGEKENLRYIPVEISGKTPSEKLECVRNFNRENEIDLLLITDLPDIAYLTNLRGMEIPYSSCFKAKALVYKDRAYIFTDMEKLPPEVKININDVFIFKNESEFEYFIDELAKTEQVSSVYYHPRSTTLAVFRKIEKLSDKIVEVKDSFISSLKAIKNDQELEHFRECFLKTDIVVNRTICWIEQSLDRGKKISEKELSDKVKSLFREEGAVGLSFEVLTACGENTAFIHYTHPSPEKIIKKEDLILLDCGAFFEGGYATDQTRTFLAGGSGTQATELQKHVYTSVLKGFLTGINYEITETTTGYDLDMAVRKVVDASKPEEFNFAHATGHGVGITVHESPPKIGPSEHSKILLREGMVFTVEPGLYNETWGGVRIENTVTAVKKDGKIEIITLTRAPLDENLINYDMLTDQEKSWLEKYNKSKIG